MKTVELTIMRAANGKEFEEIKISVTLAHKEEVQKETQEVPSQQSFIFR